MCELGPLRDAVGVELDDDGVRDGVGGGGGNLHGRILWKIYNSRGKRFLCIKYFYRTSQSAILHRV